MGLGGMKYAWQRQTKDFGHTQGDKYSCLVYDNRGIGDSDKPRARYSTSEMAKDVIEVVDHLGWTDDRQLHVIGISMGGMIAQEMVSRSLLSCIDLRAAFAPRSFVKQHLHQRRARYAGHGSCTFRAKDYLKRGGTGSKCRLVDRQALPCVSPAYLISAPLRPTPTHCHAACHEKEPEQSPRHHKNNATNQNLRPCLSPLESAPCP